MKKKRITVLAVLAATFATASVLVLVPATLAEAIQIRTPVSFILTPARCSNLQVTVEGKGESFTVINDRVDNSGVDHIDTNTLVTGNATDSDGASYVFNYHNHQSIEIPVGGLPFQVTANDHFNLNGRGRANQVHVGFVVRLTFTGPSDPPDVEVVSLRGDPEHCDGL